MRWRADDLLAVDQTAITKTANTERQLCGTTGIYAPGQNSRRLVTACRRRSAPAWRVKTELQLPSVRDGLSVHSTAKPGLLDRR